MFKRRGKSPAKKYHNGVKRPKLPENRGLGRLLYIEELNRILHLILGAGRDGKRPYR